MSESETFYHIPSAIIVLRSKLTPQNSFFSSAISVAATQNTCFVGKQEVPSDHGRKPDSAPIGILMYVFLQFITPYGFDINPGDRCTSILAKKGQKCNEKSHTETSYIYCDNAFIKTDS